MRTEGFDGDPGHQGQGDVGQQAVVQLDVGQGIAADGQHAQAVAVGERALAGPTGADCADGHATERITGKSPDEFVNNVKKHLGMIHKGMAMPPREQILAMGKKG